MTQATATLLLVVAAVWFGVMFSTGVLLTVVYDLIALRFGWRTFSRDTMYLGHRFPAVAVVLTGCLAFALGTLVGHLYFAQTP